MHAADPREEARVRQTVIAFTINLDLLNFDALMLLFADELWIDYTSLWGGVPQVLTPRDLVAQLMGIAPGFDASWHELLDIKIQIRGHEAEVECGVDGRMWIGDLIWHPIGRYKFRLEKIRSAWKITHLKLEMLQELGDRAVAEEAMRRQGNSGEGGWIKPPESS